jgi:hypothetical protein
VGAGTPRDIQGRFHELSRTFAVGLNLWGIMGKDVPQFGLNGRKFAKKCCQIPKDTTKKWSGQFGTKIVVCGLVDGQKNNDMKTNWCKPPRQHSGSHCHAF